MLLLAMLQPQHNNSKSCVTSLLHIHCSSQLPSMHAAFRSLAPTATTVNPPDPKLLALLYAASLTTALMS
jgi:hypothetical protein